MKVKASVRSSARKDGSYVVRRRGHLYVINKKNPTGRRGKADGTAQVQGVPSKHAFAPSQLEGQGASAGHGQNA